MTIEKLAERSGISVSYLSRLEKGERNLSISVLNSIAAGLDLPPRELLTEDDHLASDDIAAGEHLSSEQVASEAQEFTDPDLLDYGGLLEAGAFREVDELDQRQPHKIPHFRSPLYPKARHIVWQAVGDSMDLKHIVEGMWVEGVDAEQYLDFYGDLKDGDLVIVERSEAEGALRERTVKELHVFDDRFELHPKSSNQRHRPIVVPRGNNPLKFERVEILALVVRWFMEPPRRPR